MYIDCIVKFGTTFSWNGDGFGIAAVNDTFDKTVPVIILYNNKEVERNIEQNITLKILQENLKEEQWFLQYLITHYLEKLLLKEKWQTFS